MLRMLSPHLYLESILELESEYLRARGIRGLLLDVDCTLKDYHADEFPIDVQLWVREMQFSGIKMCLLSNGRVRRIGKLAERLDVPFVARAFKPLPFGCFRGLQVLGLDRHEVALVGDQLFADIAAGRLAQLFSILVRPTHPAEPWYTRMKRPFERLALRCMRPPVGATVPEVTGGLEDQSSKADRVDNT